MLYPYKFNPILVERVWGGTALSRYGKMPPPVNPSGEYFQILTRRIGESWEISDRDDAQSVVANGPDKGRTLREQIHAHGAQLLGTNCGSAKKFPLLVKLLDARERLSLQVHPPTAIAAKLKSEPKTEMWCVLDAEQDAHLIAGFRRGVTGANFMRAMEGFTNHEGEAKTIEDYVYRFPVRAGDTFFVPSGRMHAIDAGVVLIEIQQSSDSTYRVYDWGRVGLDGKPRQLHTSEALVCIDFKDYEPKKQQAKVEYHGVNGLWRLVECPEFHVHRLELRNTWPDRTDGSSFHILSCTKGAVGLLLPDGKEERINVGEFVLLPAALGFYSLMPLAENTQALKSYVPKTK